MRNNLFTSSFKLVTKRLIAISLLIVICACGWDWYCKVVQFPRNSFYEFYEKVDDDTLDVLCVGSSHIFCGINPVQLYDDYGIASFDLAAGSQAIWHSYYYIKEALKTQHPKVVVLDAYTLLNKDDMFPSKARSNLINMPLSYDKWQALKVAEDEEMWDTFWIFPVTHTRYNVLRRKDFDFKGGLNATFFGYNYHSDVLPYDPETMVDGKEIKEVNAITEKAEEYLRKCIELCQAEEIEIVLVNTPSPDISKVKYKYYNYIQQIADEYGVPFLNGCLIAEEVGIDYNVDRRDEEGHLNHSGVTKWTRYIGDYLVEKYDLPDHRGDKRYEAWEAENLKLKSRIRKETIEKADSMDAVVQAMGNLDGLYIAIECRGNYLPEGVEFPAFTLGDTIEVLLPGTYIIRNGAVVNYADREEEYNFTTYLKKSVLNVNNKEGNKGIVLDRVSCSYAKNGINIFVYDEYLDETVAKIALNATDEGYEFAIR